MALPYRNINKSYYRMRGSVNFEATERTKAAVEMLRSNNTKQAAVNPSEEVNHRYPTSPATSSSNSDYAHTHRRVFSDEISHQIPPSPTLTAASSQDSPLIDLCAEDDHIEVSQKPAQNKFSDDFALLWNTPAASISTNTDVLPADVLGSDAPSGNDSTAALTLRPSSRLSEQSGSSADVFYTPLTSPTQEMAKISSTTSTTSTYVLPHLRLPVLSEKAAASVEMSTSSISAALKTESSSTGASEADLPPQMRTKNLMPNSLKDNAQTPPTKFLEAKQALPESKKALLDLLRTSPASEVKAPVVSPVSPVNSTSSQDIAERKLPPHLRKENLPLEVTKPSAPSITKNPTSTRKQPYKTSKAVIPFASRKPAQLSDANVHDWSVSQFWDSGLRYDSTTPTGTNVSSSCKVSELPMGPGVVRKTGELCTVMIFDLNACNVNIFCKAFTTKSWGCKLKNNCPKIHDSMLRKQHLKQMKKKRQQSRDGNLSVGSSSDVTLKNLVTKLEGITEGSAALPTSHTSVPKTYAETTAIGILPPLPAKKQAQGAWDKNELADWARNNLDPKTVNKLLIPYIAKGYVPSKVLYSSSAKGKNRTFHPFPFLPGELRNQIWRHFLSQSALDVKVRFYRHIDGKTTIQSLSVPPPLLLVNHESRSISQPHWPTAFDNFVNSCPASVYFNFNQDRLWIHNSNPYDLAHMVDIMKCEHAHFVRYIAIPLRDYVAHPQSTMFSLCTFKNVQKIWFVAGDSKEDEPYVKKASSAALNSKMKHFWATSWKESRHSHLPPVCHLEVIPALEARHLQIDGLCWL